MTGPEQTTKQWNTFLSNMAGGSEVRQLPTSGKPITKDWRFVSGAASGAWLLTARNRNALVRVMLHYVGTRHKDVLVWKRTEPNQDGALVEDLARSILVKAETPIK